MNELLHHNDESKEASSVFANESPSVCYVNTHLYVVVALLCLVHHLNESILLDPQWSFLHKMIALLIFAGLIVKRHSCHVIISAAAMPKIQSLLDNY